MASVSDTIKKIVAGFIQERKAFKVYQHQNGTITSEKAEDETHLRGNILVSKRDLLITFRGMADSLIAQAINVEVLALDSNHSIIIGQIGEIIDYIRTILVCESMQQYFSIDTLFGLSNDQLRSYSHHPRQHLGVDHFFTRGHMGHLMAALNSLRAQSRLVELAAIHAFKHHSRPDIVKALNRLSSAIYVMMLMHYSFTEA